MGCLLRGAQVKKIGLFLWIRLLQIVIAKNVQDRGTEITEKNDAFKYTLEDTTSKLIPPMTLCCAAPFAWPVVAEFAVAAAH